MKKNLALLAPLAAVFSFALTSCGGKGVQSLKRKTYSNTSDTSGWSSFKPTGFSKVLSDTYEKQIRSDDNVAIYDLKTYLNKATVTTQAKISIKGQGTVIVPRLGVFDINDLDDGITETFQTTWSIEDGYLKSSDAIGGANYIIKENDKYWQCIEAKLHDKKYRYDITDYINDVGGFENAVIIEQASTGLKLGAGQYVGLDITGFSAEYAEYIPYANFISPGAWLNDGEIIFIIDIVASTIKSIAPKYDLVKYTYDGKKDGSDAKSASIDLGLKNEDLSIIQGIIKAIEPYFPTSDKFSVPQLEGKGTVNYFLSYENNFIRQQELLVDVKNGSLILMPTQKGFDKGIPIVDLKKFNAQININEDVKANTFKKDKVNLSDYEDITPSSLKF